MRHTSLLLLFMLGNACAPDAHGPGVSDLSGRWKAEFRTRSGAQTAHGTVDFRSAPLDAKLCPGRESDCTSMVKGTHGINFAPLLGRRVPADAVAGVDSGGQIILLFGKCCDQGEISAKGAIKDGIIRGQWIETSLGGGREGIFVIERAPQP